MCRAGLRGSESHTAAFDTKNIYIMLYAKHSTQTIAKHMTDMFAEHHLHSWVNKYTAVM